MLPMAVGMAADKVPNIRFNVAKSLSTMSDLCGSDTTNKSIIPVLDSLMEDADVDVKYFARKSKDQALKVVEAS